MLKTKSLPSEDFNPKVKVVAIAKDEARYLAEWLFHHHYFGFACFEIYINNTSDNSLDILKQVQAELDLDLRIINADTLYQAKEKHFQSHVYQQALRNTSEKEFTHIAFLDIDEFWTPNDFTTSVNTHLLNSPQPHAVHLFNWMIKRGEDTFSACFSLENQYIRNPHVKCITPVRHDLGTKVHTVVGENIEYVDCDGQTPEFIDKSLSKTRFNPEELPNAFVVHRLYRSQYEYISMLYRGRPNGMRFKSNRSGYYGPKFNGLTYQPPSQAYQDYQQKFRLLCDKLNQHQLLQRAESFVQKRYQALLAIIDAGVTTGEAHTLLRAFRQITLPDIKPYRRKLRAQAITTKVFQIGFNKSGTASIFHYFRDEGIAAIHWDSGKLSKAIHHNAAQNKPLLTGYEQFQVFTDMEHRDKDQNPYYSAESYYQQLDQQYPNSIFILNYRNIDKWINSRLNHPAYLSRTMKATGMTREQVIDSWRQNFTRHINEVREYFRDSNQLIEIDLDKDPSDKLSSELKQHGFVFAESHLPHNHKTQDRLAKKNAASTDTPPDQAHLPTLILNKLKNKLKPLIFRLRKRFD